MDVGETRLAGIVTENRSGLGMLSLEMCWHQLEKATRDIPIIMDLSTQFQVSPAANGNCAI